MFLSEGAIYRHSLGLLALFTIDMNQNQKYLFVLKFGKTQRKKEEAAQKERFIFALD
jgi:hypothetical protein